jgi:hypothetical protein
MCIFFDILELFFRSYLHPEIYVSVIFVDHKWI